MNYDLLQACQFAKTAADMTIPVEEKPVPEAGSEIVQGMVDGSRKVPGSEGAQVYADPIKQKALENTLLAAKTAAEQDAYMQGMYDGAYDYYMGQMKTAALAEQEAYYQSEMEKQAALEEAYYAGAADAIAAYQAEMEKQAADYFAMPESAVNFAQQGRMMAGRAGEAIANGAARATQMGANAWNAVQGAGQAAMNRLGMGGGC